MRRFTLNHQRGIAFDQPETYGIIRCGHANRALANAVMPVRLEELTKALAYCAVRYRLAGGEPQLDGVPGIEEAARQLPLLEADIDRSGPPPRVAERLNECPDFTAAVARLATPSNVSVALSELAEIGALFTCTMPVAIHARRPKRVAPSVRRCLFLEKGRINFAGRPTGQDEPPIGQP